VVFAAAGPARYFSRSYFVRQEAQQMADEWLGYLRAGERHKAHQLVFDSGQRAPLDDALPRYYERNPEQQRSLATFVGEEPIRAMLSLSDQAIVSNLGPVEHVQEGPRDYVVEQFHVVDPQGPNKDFYVQVTVNRVQLVSGRSAQWSIGKATKTLTPQ